MENCNEACLSTDDALRLGQPARKVYRTIIPAWRGPCPNCGQGCMRRFAEDWAYFYFKCTNKRCEKERLILKNTIRQGVGNGTA